MRLPARLAKLEAVHRKNRILLMFQDETETVEQAKVRWCAQHPGEDPDAAGTTVIMVRWLGSEPEARS